MPARSGVTALEVLCAGAMGSALMYGESTWTEYEAFARALLADRDRLGQIAANVLAGLASAAAYQARFDESTRLFAEHEASLLERGDEFSARSLGQSRGIALYLAGDLESAEHVYRRSWVALGEAGERGFRSTLGTLLAFVMHEQGRRDEAEAIVAESEALTSADDWLTFASVAAMRPRGRASEDAASRRCVAHARVARRARRREGILPAPPVVPDNELGRASSACPPAARKPLTPRARVRPPRTASRLDRRPRPRAVSSASSSRLGTALVCSDPYEEENVTDVVDAPTAVKPINHWIAGATYAGKSGRSGPVFNPATGAQAGAVDFATVDEVDKAVQAAKTALPAWRALSIAKRAEILFAVRELVHARREDIARILTAEHGKVLSDAMGEVTRGLEVIEFCCGIPHLLKGGMTEQASTGVDVYSLRQPLGVVAGITPFNFPAMVPMWMWAPALACGNTFVLKPSEKDPSASVYTARAPEGSGRARRRVQRRER